MQRPVMRLSAFMALLLIFPLAQAKTTSIPTAELKTNLDSGSIQQEPLGGLVINRTVTVLGWDFYSSFSQVWSSSHPDTPYTVTIYERPTAQYGSEIWIDYDARRVFHAFLAPARSATNEISKQAASSVYEAITAITIEQALYSDVDLAAKEM